VSNSIDGRSVTNKLAAILQTFSKGRVHSLSEVARSAGLPVSTAHRLIAELVECGFLERAPDRRYCVGSLLTQIGANVLFVPHIRSQAEQVLNDLAAALRTTVRFGVLESNTVKCLEKRPSNQDSARSQVRRLPIHATAAGKALLAFSEPETISMVIRQGLPRLTPATIVSGTALRRELAATRMNQLAFARLEFAPDTISVAAPVFARGGRVVAALEGSVTGDSPQRRVNSLQPAIIVAARALTRQFSVNDLISVNKATGAINELEFPATMDGRLA
jgi:DNA-binding IclR family transcriptional regulator